MIVSIFGANGNLAVRTIRCLLKKPGVQIRGYARSTSKIPQDIRDHSSFQEIQGEINDKERITQAVRGAEVVICLYQGFEDVVLDGQKFLIDICEAEHVDRFFADTYTSELSRLQIGQHERLDLALKIVKYLETKKIRPVHMLIGAFIETWLGYSGTVDLSTNTVSYWGEGNEIWDLTTYDDAAAYTAEAVMDRTAEGFLRFVGDRMTVLQFVDVYEKILRTKAKLVHHGTKEELYEKMYQEKAKYQSVSPWIYLPLFYTYYTMTGAFRLFDPLDNSRYPDIKPTTVEEFLRIQDLSNPQNTQRPS